MNALTTSFDGLTKADFDALGWQTLIDGCLQKECGCFQDVFRDAAVELEKKGQSSAASAARSLQWLAAMQLHFDRPRQPFRGLRPMAGVQFPDPEDFGDPHVAAKHVAGQSFAEALKRLATIAPPLNEGSIRKAVLARCRDPFFALVSQDLIDWDAEKQSCRIILSGDTAQHRAVERGDALRLLEQHAGLQAAELKEIWRQKADSHKAIVTDLRVGNLERAFKQLNKLGMLRELAPEDRHVALAADYVAAVKENKSALVISPTHAEGERVTARIREQLKQAGKLCGDERELVQLKNLQWTAAQRSDARSYRPGLIVQFHQNIPGFRRGDRVKVKGQNEAGGVLVERKTGEVVFLPVDQTARFQVYEPKTIALAPGDMIRITQNGFTKDNQRLNNGDLREICGFTKAGDIKLSNGWIVAGEYGNVTHGYCVTSYSSQSKSVDRVFVAEGSESFRATDRQQFYVSASRFKEALTIYTDDKRQLLEAVSKSSERPSATDLSGSEQVGTSRHEVIKPTDEIRIPDATGSVGEKQMQAQEEDLPPTQKQHLTMVCREKAHCKGMRA